MLLLIDNYDSFTYNLVDYFLQLGVSSEIIRNDEKTLDEIKDIQFDAIVISPGPKIPRESGILMKIIAYYYNKVPILGICLGQQAIGEFFGAKLIKNNLPMHGKTSKIMHNKHPIFNKMPKRFEAMRYHSLILTDIDKTGLEIIAYTQNNEPMAITHSTLPIFGFQFHPESILTDNGIQLLKNWIELIYTSVNVR